jgi:two-component system sensor histidine kinase BaeS
MSTPSLATPTPAEPPLDAVFGRVWPDRATPGRPRLVAASAAAGLLAALVVPFRLPGLAAFLALVAVMGVVAAADRRLLTRPHLAAGALCLLLTGTVLVRDAVWVVFLCLLAAFAVGAAVLAGGRSVAGLLVSVAAIPLAALRGLPWLGRSLRRTPTAGVATAEAGAWRPLVRTAVVSLLLVLVFGALFASADAIFARWVGALVPDLTLDDLFVRGFVGLAFTGLALAGVYVAVCPPQVERLALPSGRPVGRSFEWLVPVALVVAVFALFVMAQLAAMFGGHAYLRRTTGLTYAEYVHQGFGQLTVATLLTLAVVAVAVRKAPRSTPRDRILLQAVLGGLCALTLVVVASALYRMHVYEEAYGFTRLRLLVSVFEGWLGAVVVLVMAAGVRLRGPWVPWAALVTGAVMLLGLAAVNPDGYIAERNVARFAETGRIDWYYLSGLSADAVPALADLPERYRGCALPSGIPDDDWLAWNLGRARARAVMPDSLPPCP